MCTEARSLGVNTLWAPVADVNWNPANPIIGDRAFGSTVGEVLEPIRQTVEVYKRCGVLSCAKHFPGHGGTSIDSHHALPYLDISLDELRERDLAPFGAAIDAGVPLVMTAHIQYPQIDNTCPATLSNRIMREILREELGFQGVVVADRLEMAAVSDIFVGARPLILALGASVDMFMIGEDTDRALYLAQETLKAVTRGEVAESILYESFSRIEVLTKLLVTETPCILQSEVLARHGAVARRF